MEEGIKITSNLSEICNNSVVLCKYGEIVIPAPEADYILKRD